MVIREYGAENSRNLVFFQGSCEPWEEFRPAAEELAKVFHVMLVTPDGHDPEEHNDFISVEKTVDDTVRWLRDHGIGHLDAIYGLSFGGGMAVRFLTTQDIPVDRAIIDAGTAPYQYPKWICKLIGVRDFLMLKTARSSVKLMEAAFPTNRFARNPNNARQEYEQIRQYLKGYSNKTIWNIFWSANNYSVPKTAPELATQIQFWVGADEWGSRYRDLKWTKQYLPQIEIVKIPNMMHGEFVMMHPEAFSKKALSFLQGEYTGFNSQNGKKREKTSSCKRIGKPGFEEMCTMRHCRVTVIFLVICAVISLGSISSAEEGVILPEQVLAAGNPDQVFEQGNRTSMNGLSVVNLHGSWYEMGRQYGALMRDELNEVHLFAESIIEYSYGNAEKAESIISVQTAQTPYRVSEFLRGASETSGLTVRQLQAVNAVERIGGLPKCGAAFCWGEYAAGPLVIGRNYDYSDAFALLKDDVAITVYHPADGSLAVATIGYVGEIYAVNGFNEKGIFMELNNGKPSANIKSPDNRVTGTTMLFSALFEVDELEDWDLFFNTVNCSSSYIINVADSEEAISYEWCPIGVKHGGTDQPEGLLVSTNYFVNPDWLFATPSDAASWEGLTRRSNLIALCEASKGQIDDRKMLEIIGTALEDGGAMNELTVFQMVMIPETGMLWLRVIGGSGWTQIDLSGFLLN